jgi:hypothetical protein
MPDLEPSSLASSLAQATPNPAAPSTPLDVERAGLGFSQSDDPTTEGPAPPSASPRAQRGRASCSAVAMAS